MNISSVFANTKVFLPLKRGPNELENQTTEPSELEMNEMGEGVRHIVDGKRELYVSELLTGIVTEFWGI